MELKSIFKFDSLIFDSGKVLILFDFNPGEYRWLQSR